MRETIGYTAVRALPFSPLAVRRPTHTKSKGSLFGGGPNRRGGRGWAQTTGGEGGGPELPGGGVRTAGGEGGWPNRRGG